MLARPEMAWDSDPLGALLQDHIFFSKEASSGVYFIKATDNTSAQFKSATLVK